MELLHLIRGGGRLCIHLALGNTEHISFIQAPLCYFFFIAADISKKLSPSEFQVHLSSTALTETD